MTDIQKCKENPTNFATKCSQSKLEKFIQKCNKCYHNNQSIISDNQYDILIDYVKLNYPDSTVLTSIGSTVIKEKVTLPTFLGSMDKVKSISSWVKKYPNNWILSDKLDGISLLLTKNDAYTRGNGTEGQKINWIIPYLSKYKLLNDDDMIRGELIISKNNWKTVKQRYPEYSNPRNFVSGLVSKKEKNEELLKYIDFVGYEYISEPPIPIEMQMKQIQDTGISVVNNTKITQELNNDILSNYLLNRRKESNYEIDGIIITHNEKAYNRPDKNKKNPSYAKAFKMILDSQNAETFVKSIIWTPSIYGVLKPVVDISEVTIEGVKINRVTGNNANFIVNNSIGGLIGPGAKLLITRSGGVIPKIIQVLEPYKEDYKNCFPNGKYQWNNTKVDIVLEDPLKDEIVQKKRIEHFFKSIKVNYLKEGIIQKLYNHNFKTIKEIINMTIDDFLKIDGIQETMAGKLHAEIQSKYTNSNFSDILTGSAIFQGVGPKTFTILLENVTGKYILEYKQSEYNQYYEKLTQIKGLGKENIKKMLDKLPEFNKFVTELTC